MEGLRLDDVTRALETRDPTLVEMVSALANSHSYEDESDVPDGVLTIQRFLAQMRSWEYRWNMSDDERYTVRTEGWQRLEDEDNAKALPDRYRLHELLDQLHDTDGAYAREALLAIIRNVPIKLGIWKGIKRMFKDAERSGDLELYGTLLARIDSELAGMWGDYGEVSRRTMNYLSRRGWRFMRRRGESFPASYVDTAVAVLREYPEGTNFNRTWVANHIIYHNYELYGGRCYGQASFKFWRPPDSKTKHRAFNDLWKVESRPLFGLLERARSETARSFAIEGLKADFKAELRELDKDALLRLIAVPSGTVQDFVVWLLENAPRFEQAAFKELGLHDAILGLLDSDGDTARAYAVKYARTHARDLPLSDLLNLANHYDDDVRELAAELLNDLDPRKDVGLDAWGRLLGSSYAHDYAVEVLHTHFGASELTLEWFKKLFFEDNYEITEFAVEHFAEVHDVEKVDPMYFVGLMDSDSYDVPEFAVGCLSRFDLSKVDLDVFRQLLLHDEVTDDVREWIEEERVDPVAIGVDYWRALAFRPTWAESSWVAASKADGPKFLKDKDFDPNAAYFARRILSDVRNFTASEIGFEWLMNVVRGNQEEPREWATNYMYEAFAPAEFAAQTESAGNEDADLGQKTFLFTGKLSTMTRSEAQKKVADANGKKAGSVTKTLDYLVIGDEGSPLYGEGAKGSKQRKAESLNDGGASINIISETAFLQMLAGGRREYGEEATIAGCEALWEMGTGPEAQDDAVAVFARQYLRRHHDVIGPKLTDKTVEASRALPEAFLTQDRVWPLLTDSRAPVRALALEIARYEIARWSPAMDALVALSETKRVPLRSLVSDALLSDDDKENARIRLSPDAMDVDGVYRFCESLDRPTRAIGMALIARYPQFAEPAALYRLTDSPDRRVRAFVIQTVWRMYRDHGSTSSWQPRPLDATYESRADVRFERGSGPVERPEQLPATKEALRDFLRRILFGIPPARLPKGEDSGGGPRPLPARRAKLYLIEVMRDLALQDRAFAELVTPLFEEFVATLGKSERAACLVALARLEDRWGGL